MLTLLDFSGDGNDPTPAGDALRDQALGRFRVHRPVLTRRLMRAFLTHLLDHGDDTSDAVRSRVPIPAGTDARVVGSAVRGLAELHLITSIGRRKSHRAVAHSRKVDVWRIVDTAKARSWLSDNPDLDPPADAPAPLPPTHPCGCTSAAASR